MNSDELPKELSPEDLINIYKKMLYGIQFSAIFYSYPKGS